MKKKRNKKYIPKIDYKLVRIEECIKQGFPITPSDLDYYKFNHSK